MAGRRAGGIEGSADARVDAPPLEVWPTAADPRRAAGWWPHCERVEHVEGGRFTLLQRSRRGVPVRADWRVLRARKPHSVRYGQDLDGTPFGRVLASSELEVVLEDDGSGGTLVRVVVERRLVQDGALGRPLARRAARRTAAEAVAGIRARMAD